MKKRILCAALVALSAAAVPTGQASAQALPAWKIADICAVESAPGQCAAFEGQALRAVSASWPFVLDPIKQACLAELKLPLDQSWRLLAECLDTEASKASDRTAVQTSRTPAEPVPPPKPPEPPAAAATAPPPSPPTAEAAPPVQPPAAPAPAAAAPPPPPPLQPTPPAPATTVPPKQ